MAGLESMAKLIQLLQQLLKSVQFIAFLNAMDTHPPIVHFQVVSRPFRCLHYQPLNLIESETSFNLVLLIRRLR